MSNFSLGKAEGEIGLKYTGRPAAAAAKKDVGEIGDAAKRNSGHLDTMGTKAGLAGLAIAAGIGLAVKAAVSFEARLSGIAAVTGATGKQMDQVRVLALKLGKDTKFSADEAAVAIEELAKAGISLPDIMNGAAAATVALAAAGEIALPRAAEIAANAMNVFSLKAQDLPHVADLIAGAANASAIDVEQFAQSLQQSGAAAALAGIDFDDLTTAIALMGNSGIKGSDAGTSLKTMLLNLQPETKKQTTLMRNLGIITKDGSNRFFDAHGKAKSLSQISGVLQEALKGQTKQQQLSTLSILFGSDAIRAAAILTKNGAKGFDAMAASIGKVKAADVAAKRMDNFKGSLEQFKGSLETAGIAVGSVLLPALRQLLDGITDLVNGFLSLSPEMQSAILYGVGAAAAFLLVFGAITKVVSIFSALSSGLAAAFAANPVILILALIIAVAAAVFILYQRFQPVREVVDNVGRALRDAFERSLPTLKEIARVAVQVGIALRDAFIAALPTLRAIFDIIVNKVVPAIVAWYKFLFNTFGPLFAKLAGIIREFVLNIISYFRSIQPQLTAIFNFLRKVFDAVFPVWLAIVKVIMPQIFKFVTSTLRLLAAAISLILSGVANVFRGIFNIIGGIFRIFISILTGRWGEAWKGVLQVLKGVLQIILGVIQSVIGLLIVGIILTSLKLIGAAFRGAWSLVTGIVRGGVGAIRALITGGMTAVRALISSVLNAIRSAFATQFAALRAIAAGAVRGVLNAFQGLGRLASTVGGFFSRMVTTVVQWVSKLIGHVKGIPGRVTGALGDLSRLLFNAGQKIIQGLIDGIKSMAGKVGEAAKAVAGKVGGFFPHSPVEEGPLTAFNRGHAGKEIMRLLIGGIESQERELARALSSVTAPVPNLILGPTTALVESAARTTTIGAGNLTTSFPAGLEDAIGGAVADAMAGAEITVGGDGLARLVVKKIGPFLVKGVRR